MNIRTLTKKLKAKYTFVGGEQHGYVKVGMNDLYGFVDCAGKVVIPLSYEWCTAFMRIKLYGKTYIGALVEWENNKAIIDKNNSFIVEPMARNAASYIINEKLWVQDSEGLADVDADPYELVRQAKEYDNYENDSLWNKIQQNCRMAFYSHPQMVHRAKEIDRWKNSYIYRQIQSF